jgi:hypothetical protein
MKLKYGLLVLPWIVFLGTLYDLVWGNHFPFLRSPFGRETLRISALISGLTLSWYMAVWEESLKRKSQANRRIHAEDDQARNA